MDWVEQGRAAVSSWALPDWAWTGERADVVPAAVEP